MNILLLSDDILKLIASFLIRPRYKLSDWVAKEYLNWKYFEMAKGKKNQKQSQP